MSLGSAAAVGALLVDSAREDPAQDQLRLVIIGLVSIAVVLVVVQVVLWRVTSPRRRMRTIRVEGPAPTAVATPSAPVAETSVSAWNPAPAPAPTPTPTPTPTPDSVVKVPLGSLDAPWPPARVSHRGSARGPRPPDAEGSVLARLAAIPDLEVPGQRDEASI